jgi:hypothetical protein
LRCLWNLGFVEFPALVAAGQDGDVAAAVAEGAGEQFDHRGFSSASHRDVADGHHLGAQMVLGFPAAPVAPDPDLHHNPEKSRQRPHQEAHQRRTESLGATKDHIRSPAFEFFDQFLHRADRRCSAGKHWIKQQTGTNLAFPRNVHEPGWENRTSDGQDFIRYLAK